MKLKPGELNKLTIRPFDTANVYKKGHRIRLDISSSNFLRFDVNPNTGEPPGQSRRTLVVDNTAFHEAKYASTLKLRLCRPRSLPARGNSMVARAGVQPATFALGVRCSMQLSYRATQA